MSLLLNAIFPIFALILLGYYFKRISFPSREFWPMADRFTYYVFMPSLLIYKLANAQISDSFEFGMVYTGLGVITAFFVLFLLIYKIRPFDPAGYTSIIQGGIRYNTYIFLAIIDSLYGDKGLITGIVFITFAIPLINVFCISSFAIYIDTDKITYKKFINSILKNPLIIACFIGGVINFGGIYIPIGVENIFAILAPAALPLGLLSVGVGLEVSHIKYAKTELLVSSVIKLAVFPLGMFAASYLSGISDIYQDVLVLFGAMPTAVSAYILARELGGDTKLMSSIVTVQTLFSFASIAIVVATLLEI